MSHNKPDCQFKIENEIRWKVRSAIEIGPILSDGFHLNTLMYASDTQNLKVNVPLFIE